MQKIKVRKDVANQVTVKLQSTIGQTADGQIYDLTDPTEKFYYDLKKEFEKIDDEEDFEKAYGVKYKYKKLINGKWRYYYADGREETKKWFETDATKQDLRNFIHESLKNKKYKEYIKICDLPSHFADKLQKKLGIRLKTLVLSSWGLRHSFVKKEHKINPEDILLFRKVIQNKKTVIEWEGESWRKHQKLISFRGYSNGTIFFIATFNKHGELQLFDCYRKEIDDDIEKSVRFPCTSPETNALDGSQPKLTISFIDNLSSKNITKSLTISDKLFRLWQRRLSPELQNEMLKLMDNERDYFYLIPKKVYAIEGYPEGQDLENCELMELADTYFIIACGGDWQDEKLVKFEIGNNNKLSASVVKNCEKEDKRVLKKKVTFILNPETINKSLFTDWKVELHHLCDKKGLDYDSVIQKYDDKLTRYVAEEQLHQDAENVIAYKAYKELNKSLTYSGHKLQGRTRLYGMDISIENKKGSYRSGVDKDGHKWKVLMHYDYGYIRGTVGTDSDHLDCYVGSDKNANKVYVIHQNDPVTHKYDEDKCMLCFSSAADAKKAYMKQYDRSGFYGSMTTMTIDQFKSFVFSHKGQMIHKSFDINITDITENNKQQKLEQVNKALNAIANNQPFMIKHIPADASTNYGNLLVRIRDFDKSKIEKAVHKIALSLDANISGASKGETFVYKAQEELTDKFFKEFTDRTRAIYNFLIAYFDLPDIRIVSKAGELKHKGKILYNPSTGIPIKESDWKKFVVELEKYLNRNYTGIGEKIVLSAESLGIILDRLSKTNSMEAIRKMSLSEIKAKRYDVDWIGDSIKNMKDKFGDVISRERQARIQIAMDSAAQRVTKVKDDMRNNIQQIIIDGIRDKQSKSVVAQNLFDKCASLNRDMQRIADTEFQMASTRGYLKEEVYNTPKDEKVYFKRFEMIDDNTCKKCKKINGKVVLWSDVPLPDEHIKDEFADIAIWEGKTEGDYPESVLHPWCRGAWIRYYPEVENV